MATIDIGLFSPEISPKLTTKTPIGTLVRDNNSDFFFGEIIGSLEHGGWIVHEVLWQDKTNGKYTTLELEEDLEIIGSVN